MFEDIHSAGQRMLALVNDLLEVSKLESTVGTFHLERIDLRGLIQPVVKELEPLLRAASKPCTCGCQNCHWWRRWNPLRLQQVIAMWWQMPSSFRPWLFHHGGGAHGLPRAGPSGGA